MWFLFYNLALTSALVLALPLLPLLVCLGPRYRRGLTERCGCYRRALLASLAGSRPVWIHAASVGEVQSAIPLINAFKARVPARKILVSTFTATGNHHARQIAGVDAVIFFPLDLIWIVRRALLNFDPSLLVIIETEIWPNLLHQAYRRGVPTLLLSGRLSAKSLARYKLCRDFFRSVLGCFSVFGMQTAEDAERIIDLGASKHKVSIVGTLKGAQWQPQSLAPARGSAANGKPLLVAGSTHRGEEESLLEALRLLRAHFPTLSLVIAPRHPERFDDVERILAGSGFVFQRRSRVLPEQWFEKDVLLLDSVGELVNFFAAADVAFVGGSLVEVGGHNVLEPARFGKPILFGPHMENFRSLATDLIRQGAALEVANAREMAGAVEQLLADPARRRDMGERAVAVAASHQRAFEMNLDLAERYL